MSFELFIASRYLVSRRKQTFISVISLMSVLGVAIGVAALVVVMGVYNGYHRHPRPHPGLQFPRDGYGVRPVRL